MSGTARDWQRRGGSQPRDHPALFHRGNPRAACWPWPCPSPRRPSHAGLRWRA